MTTLSFERIDAAIESLARAIAKRHAQNERLVLAGIANGGITLCKLLRAKVNQAVERDVGYGIIDISFHRDDIGHKPITRDVEVTQLMQDPEGASIILVDDVLFSGRTIRAAMAEVHAIGRPYEIELAVLVDRGNRRLPISPNYTGLTIETTVDQEVRVFIDPMNPEKSEIVLS